MPGDESEYDLVERWRQGDQEAGNIIANRYGERLARLISRYMSPRLRQRLDPEDIVQSTFRSFFERTKQGQFRIASSADLLRLLIKIARNKTVGKQQIHSAAKRDMAAETELASGELEELAVSREDPPSDVVAMLDAVEKVLKEATQRDADIFALRLQDYKYAEIAKKLGITLSAVRSSLDRIKRKLQSLLNGDEDQQGPESE